MLSKWTVNNGEHKGLEVVVLRPEKDRCLCFDRKGVFYLFRKKDLSIKVEMLGGMKHGCE